MSFDFFHVIAMLGVALVVILATMGVFCILYLLMRRPGLIDSSRGVSLVLAALTYFILGEGYGWRKWLAFLAVGAWGILSAYRSYQHLPLEENDKYASLLGTGKEGLLPPVRSKRFKTLYLFLLQGLLVTLLSFPLALINDNNVPYFKALEVFGLLLWGIGLAGGAVADRQLLEFHQFPANQGQVCDEGLWYCTRHPDYFFDWVLWTGLFIMALAAPWGWLALICPFLLYYLLAYQLTPLSEKALAQTKGTPYEAYRVRTSSFFPWAKKESDID